MEAGELWCHRIAERMRFNLEYYMAEIAGIANACRPRRDMAQACPDIETMVLNNAHGRGRAGMRLFTVSGPRPSDGRRYGASLVDSVSLFEGSEDPDLARRWRLELTAERDQLAEKNAMLRRRLDEEIPVLRAALTRVERLGLVGALVVQMRKTGAGTARWIGEFIGRRD
jgi:hypothetical protein